MVNRSTTKRKKDLLKIVKNGACGTRTPSPSRTEKKLITPIVIRRQDKEETDFHIFNADIKAGKRGFVTKNADKTVKLQQKSYDVTDKIKL